VRDVSVPEVLLDRCGERTSAGLVESTINQFIAKRFVKK
jgi:hypothetical protein